MFSLSLDISMFGVNLCSFFIIDLLDLLYELTNSFLPTSQFDLQLINVNSSSFIILCMIILNKSLGVLYESI
jgi:hypothetical protein